MNSLGSALQHTIVTPLHYIGTFHVIVARWGRQQKNEIQSSSV